MATFVNAAALALAAVTHEPLAAENSFDGAVVPMLVGLLGVCFLVAMVVMGIRRLRRRRDLPPADEPQPRSGSWETPHDREVSGHSGAYLHGSGDASGSRPEWEGDVRGVGGRDVRGVGGDGEAEGPRYPEEGDGGR